MELINGNHHKLKIYCKRQKETKAPTASVLCTTLHDNKK